MTIPTHQLHPQWAPAGALEGRHDLLMHLQPYISSCSGFEAALYAIFNMNITHDVVQNNCIVPGRRVLDFIL